MSPATAVGLPAAFLSRIRAYPSLPSHTWYYLTLITLSVCNKPEFIAPLLSHAFTHSAIPGSADAAYVKEERAWLARNPGQLGKVDGEGRESALRILRRCREGLVKSGAIGGLPKAINSLYHLRKCHDPHLLDPLPTNSSISPSTLHPLSSAYPTLRPNSIPSTYLDTQELGIGFPQSAPPSPTLSNVNPTLPFLNRGRGFFNTLYGPQNAPKVRINLQKSSPDLQILATWVYALILSESTVLSPKETSFTLIAALIPQDVNAQLKPHLQGAVNNGATTEEVEAVRGMLIELCTELGVGWKGEVAKL
ncbi:hypothetical protein Dda_6878 [Drechslerella dactyloides]|uniref:Carboxymuconolactone decarboxylase-like domain-containing protein n=1 Tax=Drechslerella dactyloides TaxID=74499 RepID=A0AAD6IUA2_DREDA|nr:hypothetical protein Dda_6878 [Drechslerella dactyloides]